MVKLICFLKRRPGMSRDEFLSYWRDKHGPLVAGTKSGSHVIRYEQHPRATADAAQDPDGWDGVTEQWFSSLDDFYASLEENDYKDIEADIPKFLDAEKLVFIMTDEPTVVIDGKVS